MTPYVLLLDDDQTELEKTKQLLENNLIVKIIPIDNADNIMPLLTDYATHFSAFILDIEMTGQSHTGIDIAKKIRQIPGCLHTPLIFLSSYAHYSGGVLKDLHYYDFICKPYNSSILLRVLQQALAIKSPISLSSETQDNILFDGTQFSYEVNTNTISCIELFRNEIIITNLLGNDTTYVVKPKAFSAICNQLENMHTALAQVHRCYIINLNRIKHIERSKNTAQITLFNVQKTIPIGKSFFHLLDIYK